MGTFFDIALMVSNYSHDIATAMLAVSAAAMYIISKSYPNVEDKSVDSYFFKLNGSINKIAKYSLLWILIAGVPRIVFFTSYEWYSGGGNMLIAAIIIKHVIMFTLVGIGLMHWGRLRKKVKTLKLKYNEL